MPVVTSMPTVSSTATKANMPSTVFALRRTKTSADSARRRSEWRMRAAPRSDAMSISRHRNQTSATQPTMVA